MEIKISRVHRDSGDFPFLYPFRFLVAPSHRLYNISGHRISPSCFHHQAMLLTHPLPILRSIAPHNLSQILHFSRAMSNPSEQLILTSRSVSNKVVILTLNRPKALNALSSPLFAQLNAELEKADNDDGVRAVVITGGDKVFAAGADIKEMRDKECMWSASEC